MNTLSKSIECLSTEIQFYIHKLQNNNKLGNSIFYRIDNCFRMINIMVYLIENGYENINWKVIENMETICLNDYLVFEELFNRPIPKKFEKEFEKIKQNNPEKIREREDFRKYYAEHGCIL